MKTQFPCPECDGTGLSVCPCCDTEEPCECCDGTGLDVDRVNVPAFVAKHKEMLTIGPTWSVHSGGIERGRTNGRQVLMYASFRQEVEE